MKVLMINAIYGSRSSGKSLGEIKSYLEANGHTAYVATPNAGSGEYYHQIGTRIDHKYHGLMSRLTGLQAYFSRHATRKLVKYVDKIQPDIVHMQVVHGNYLYFHYFVREMGKRDIPVVFVLDDCWHFTGKCCHYTADKCYRWMDGCGSCPRIHQDNPSWLFDFSAKMYRDKKAAFEALDRKAVVAVSDWLLGEAKQSFLHRATLMRRIYNSIDLNVFKPNGDSAKLKAEMGLESKHVVLGVAAAWQDKAGLSKGIKLFLDLSNRLPEEYCIVLVGKPAPDVVLPHNIISVPFVENAEQLSAFYSMADVFVQMSSEETFGKVTAEALSCGTPVIVFDSTANPELVGHGCGYVEKNKDVAGVMECIERIVQEGKDQYSEFCRMYAQTNFDAQRNAQEYYRLYDELLRKQL